MKLNIHEYLAACGLAEKLYPGKRHVQKIARPGQHRSHCVEYDWRDPSTLRLEVRAGLTGRALPAKDLKKYPASFQTRTYVEFAMADDAGDDSKTEGGTGEGGGGGNAPRKAALPRLHAFRDMMHGAVPDMARVKALVLMGKTIAPAAMATVLESLAAQIRTLTVAPVNLLAAVAKVTHVAPGGFGHIAPAKGQVAYRPHDWAAQPG